MIEQEFLIGEAARMLGLATETLRLYEKTGVVAFRRCGHVRVVTLKDIETIRAHRKIHRPGRPKKSSQASITDQA